MGFDDLRGAAERRKVRFLSHFPLVSCCSCADSVEWGRVRGTLPFRKMLMRTLTLMGTQETSPLLPSHGARLISQ